MMNNSLTFSKTNNKTLYVFYILTLVLISPVIILKNILFSRWRALLKISLFFSIFATIGFWAAFVVQINEETRERYSIEEYGKNLEQISAEKENLEMQLAKINFSNTQSELMAKLDFEKISQMHYVKVLNGQVVQR